MIGPERNARFPIHTLRLEPPGGWQQEPDLRIDAVTAARRVTVGWKSEFKVKVSGQGTRGAPVTVQVFENGQLRAEKPTQIPDEGGERELVFEFEHAKIGIYNYRVFVPPLPGEKNKDDNEYTLTVEVIDARNRLLYVEGIPRWEFKFLRRTLLGEQQISPVIFFTGPDGAPQGGTPVGNVTADMTPQQLAFFKIVHAGQYRRQGARRAAREEPREICRGRRQPGSARRHEGLGTGRPRRHGARQGPAGARRRREAARRRQAVSGPADRFRAQAIPPLRATPPCGR